MQNTRWTEVCSCPDFYASGLRLQFFGRAAIQTAMYYYLQKASVGYIDISGENPLFSDIAEIFFGFPQHTPEMD